MGLKKQLTYLTGFFEKMSKPETILLKDKAPKKRAVVTFVTEDEQKAFFEVRDSVIARIEKLGIQNGDQIEIGFVFIGLEKSGRVYNNLFINEIDYVN